MSLKTRLALLVACAVALIVLLSSAAAWILVRETMYAQVDQELLGKVPDAAYIAELSADIPGNNFAQLRLTHMIQSDPVGIQLTDATGTLEQRVAYGELSAALAQAPALPEAPDDGQPGLSSVTLGAQSYRVLAVEVSNDGRTLHILQPVSGVEDTLAAVAWTLVGIAVSGIAAAALLGWVVSRTALRPVGRLVSDAEAISLTQDLRRRLSVESSRSVEMVKISEAINTMLSALEQARSQQRELIENASHELRTPLAVLRNDFGLLARMEDQGGQDQQRAELIDDLQAQVAALSREVDQIVTLARGEQPEEERVLTRVDHLVGQVVERMRRWNDQVHLDLRASDVTAAVFPQSLERAVANLVRNAIQVSPAGSQVTVTVTQESAGVSISVEDAGPGVPEQDAADIFTRFYRGDTARSYHGSGLGLAIVAQSATLHGGTVTVQNRVAPPSSESPSASVQVVSGAQFRLLLP